VLRALPETGLFRECDGRFAVFVDDSRAMLKAHFDTEFAKKETFLCSRAEAYDLSCCGVKNRQACLGRAPRDGTSVDEEDVADRRGQTGVSIYSNY